MIEFTIEYKIIPKRDSLNAIYAGIHWCERRQNAINWHLAMRAAIKRDAKMHVKPVEISFKFPELLDLDNFGQIQKMLIDGLKGRIIRDDTPEYVRKIIMEFHDAPTICVQVREMHGAKQIEIEEE